MAKKEKTLFYGTVVVANIEKANEILLTVLVSCVVLYKPEKEVWQFPLERPLLKFAVGCAGEDIRLFGIIRAGSEVKLTVMSVDGNSEVTSVQSEAKDIHPFQEFKQKLEQVH